MYKTLLIALTVTLLTSTPWQVGNQIIPMAMAENDETFDPTSLCSSPAIAITGTLTNGAEWLICHPPLALWNGNLLLLSHGTVSALRPECAGQLECLTGQVSFDVVSIPDTVTSLGSAFGVVARSKVGLSVIEGIDETKQLRQVFEEQVSPPIYTFDVGISQGGLIATLINEELVGHHLSGTLAVCGPIGNFRYQTQHLFDFGVITEALLRESIAVILSNLGINANTLLQQDENGNPQVPAAVLAKWNAVKDAILAETSTDTWDEIFDCARIPTDDTGMFSPQEIAEDLLDEVFRANNDAIQVLQGNPAGNLSRFYFCPNSFVNTFRVNRKIKRFAFTANPELMALHKTTGDLYIPLVTLHNNPDHRVPFQHVLRYLFKTVATGSIGNFTPIPISRFGHCNVTVAEAVGALSLLVSQAGGDIYEFESVLPNSESISQFRDFIKRFDNLH